MLEEVEEELLLVEELEELEVVVLEAEDMLFLLEAGELAQEEEVDELAGFRSRDSLELSRLLLAAIRSAISFALMLSMRLCVWLGLLYRSVLDADKLLLFLLLSEILKADGLRRVYSKKC